MANPPAPSILGFTPTNSNKDLSTASNWGKNQFANTFPIGLAAYMHQQEVSPVYLTLDRDLTVNIGHTSVTDIFGLAPFSETLYYSFESEYEPYRPFVVGALSRIDLVTMEVQDGHHHHLRPIEIKLTALPDSSTVNADEEDFGSEIVVRPDTIVYLALSIIKDYEGESDRLYEILDPVFGRQNVDWTDASDVKPLILQIKECLNRILLEKIENQFPYVMQPIWKTVGKSLNLENECFDIFMWSNYAFTRLFVDAVVGASSTINRKLRTIVWLARMLYDYSDAEKLDYQHIIDNYTFNTKNDKAFAVNGAITNPYMRCPELTTPRISKEAVSSIILNGGQNFLSPERRLDAAIQASDFFT